MLDEVKIYAKLAHLGQVRRVSGKSFYEEHLVLVANLVKHTNGSELAVMLAYLHDVLEDTNVTWEELKAYFPELCYSLKLLTEKGNSWKNRKERYAHMIPHFGRDEYHVSLCDKVVTGWDFINEWMNEKYGDHPQEIIWMYTMFLDAYKKNYWYSEYFEIVQQIEKILCDLELFYKEK
jgi:hypothetical protein